MIPRPIDRKSNVVPVALPRHLCLFVVYLYGAASSSDYRKTVPQIRAGEYEGLQEKVRRFRRMIIEILDFSKVYVTLEFLTTV